MTHKASGCEEQTLVGMDGAEPKKIFYKIFLFHLTNQKFCGIIFTET